MSDQPPSVKQKLLDFLAQQKADVEAAVQQSTATLDSAKATVTSAESALTQDQSDLSLIQTLTDQVNNSGATPAPAPN